MRGLGFSSGAQSTISYGLYFLGSNTSTPVLEVTSSTCIYKYMNICSYIYICQDVPEVAKRQLANAVFIASDKLKKPNPRFKKPNPRFFRQFSAVATIWTT